MEKISVIVPVKNGAAWIRECLNSIQNQTWRNIEILVVNNGSTDDTETIVKELAQQDDRIQLFNQKDQGVSAGRNLGIEQSCGELITFVDADDKIDVHMLEELVQCLKNENSDLAVCDYIRWDGKNTCQQEGDISEVRQSGKESAKSQTTVTKEVYVSDYLLRGYTRCWSVLYRRSVIGDVRFRRELAIGEDMMFLVDLLDRLQRVTISSYKGYFYRINPQGAMLRPFTRAYMDEIKAWRLAADRICSEYPEQKARISSIQAVSAILVAGKLAVMAANERLRYQDCILECRLAVKEALKVPGARKELPAGYGIKTVLFRVCPQGYIWLYHIWKK